MNKRMMYAGLVAMFAAAVVLVLLMSPVSAQVRQPFEWIFAKRLTVETTADVGTDLNVGGDLTVDGAINVLDSLAAVGTLGVSGDLNVTDDATIADSLTVSGTSNLVGNTTVAGTFAANGNSLSVAKTMNLARQGAIAVSDGGTITPTGTFQELTAAGAVGASVAAPAAAGQLVVLFNSTTNNITITDTTGIALTSNAVLGQNDSVTIISTAAGQWMEVARANN